VSWDSRFAEPIELPDGVRLASLREAIVHLVNTVPSSERGTPVVLTAAELITSAAERGGPVEFARIATLRAINRHPARVRPVAQRAALGTAGHATRCPNTGAGRGVEIGELPELPCRGQLNLSEPVNHTATYRC
jgi:hypothetical protein